MKKQEMANTSLKENRTHGTVQYPVALYEWNGENEWHVVPHWHEEMEWIYFQKGDFPVWINTKEYQVHAPAFMCIHPEELHALILEKDGIESAVVFPLDILCFERYDAAEAKVLGPLAEGKLRMPVLCQSGDAAFEELSACYKEIEQVLRQMKEHDTKKVQHLDSSITRENVAGEPKQNLQKNMLYLNIKAKMLELIAVAYKYDLFTRQVREDREESGTVENLKKVLQYIGEHYGSPIRLSELAELVNMNEQYFCRFFKKYLGKTPMAYINTYRLQQAALLLETTDIPITTLCLECGFNNLGHFFDKFKSLYGITPLQFRKGCTTKSQNRI
jgi:AraC-like DNA-binding protein